MILALDFDGVLHSADADDSELFQHAHLIWQVLRARPTVEVVLSTSWRGTHPHDELVMLVTRGGGEALAPRLIGSTPVRMMERGSYINGPVHVREKEIQLWLAGNGLRQRPWIALDDSSVDSPQTAGILSSSTPGPDCSQTICRES